MAAYSDQQVGALLSRVLHPGEHLMYWAYGYKAPNPVVTALFLGAIGQLLFTKHFIVGLTSHRLIVIRFSGKLRIREVRAWYRLQMPPVATRSGRVVRILVQDRGRPVRVDFHKRGVPFNRDRAAAIAAALSHTHMLPLPAPAYIAPHEYAMSGGGSW